MASSPSTARSAATIPKLCQANYEFAAKTDVETVNTADCTFLSQQTCSFLGTLGIRVKWTQAWGTKEIETLLSCSLLSVREVLVVTEMTHPWVGPKR